MNKLIPGKLYKIEMGFCSNMNIIRSFKPNDIVILLAHRTSSPLKHFCTFLYNNEIISVYFVNPFPYLKLINK